ncbi:MAG: hypothetical protein HFF61_10650 [Oscillospiraceae bacterium]|nr:hypothetical protein [Oscillospiraceae bacterium]
MVYFLHSHTGGLLHLLYRLSSTTGLAFEAVLSGKAVPPPFSLYQLLPELGRHHPIGPLPGQPLGFPLPTTFDLVLLLSFPYFSYKTRLLYLK